jgi:hypothetical protein
MPETVPVNVGEFRGAYEDKLDVKATVPVEFGNVIVLSAVGSAIVRVVSYESVVAPSNIRLPFNSISFFTIKLILANEVHYPLKIIITHYAAP